MALAARPLLNVLLLRCMHAFGLMVCAAVECLRTLRWLIELPQPLHDHTFKQLPEHIGIVIGVRARAPSQPARTAPASRHRRRVLIRRVYTQDGEFFLPHVARLVDWCADAGIRYVTLCDAEGDLMRAEADLRAALGELGVDATDSHSTLPAARPPSLPQSPSSAAEGRTIGVRVVHMQTGRDEVMAATRGLCEAAAGRALPPDAINEDVLGARLGAASHWPDPALVLQFCPEMLLGGMPPWTCRVSHYLPMGRLDLATPASLRRALRAYDGVQQRNGR